MTTARENGSSQGFLVAPIPSDGSHGIRIFLPLQLCVTVLQCTNPFQDECVWGRPTSGEVSISYIKHGGASAENILRARVSRQFSLRSIRVRSAERSWSITKATSIVSIN